jgi:hypothetical protein
MKIRVTFTDQVGDSHIAEVEGSNLLFLIDQAIAMLGVPVKQGDRRIDPEEYWARVRVEVM